MNAARERMNARPAQRRVRSPIWIIRGSLDRRLYWLIATASFALGLAAWWAVTALELVDPLFLPGPGHIDSVWRIDLPPALQRTQDLKLSQAFLAMESEILGRIRATSGLQSDLDALHRLTGKV